MVTLNGTQYSESFLILLGDVCKDFERNKMREGQKYHYKANRGGKRYAEVTCEVSNGDLFITENE